MDWIGYITEALKNTLLFLLVGISPWLIVAFIMQFLSNSLRKSLAKLIGLKAYIYLTCPGVMAHEIGHALFCIIFRHKIVEMKLFSPSDDGTLGYVNHSYNPNSLFQKTGNFFIGTGPIWLGITLVWLISSKMLPDGMLCVHEHFLSGTKNFLSCLFSLEFWSHWQSYLWLYLAITISSHVTLSPPDLSGSAKGSVSMIFFVLLIFLLTGWFGDWELAFINWCKNLFISVINILIFVIVLLIVLCTVGKIISLRK